MTPEVIRPSGKLNVDSPSCKLSCKFLVYVPIFIHRPHLRKSAFEMGRQRMSVIAFKMLSARLFIPLLSPSLSCILSTCSHCLASQSRRHLGNKINVTKDPWCNPQNSRMEGPYNCELVRHPKLFQELFTSAARGWGGLKLYLEREQNARFSCKMC